MRNDIDDIISVMNRIIGNKTESELGEQDATPAATGAADSGGDKPPYPTVTKWVSGVTRGKSNQIDLTKWESGVTRGKANTLL